MTSMRPAKAILVSTDAGLVAAARQSLRSLTDLQLVVVPGAQAAYGAISRGDCSLILAHRPDDGDGVEAADLLRWLASTGRRIPTLVLSDSHRPEEALRLLRCGAVEYMSRPLDLNRLAYLADSVTLRDRYGAPAPAREDRVVRMTVDDNPFLYKSEDAMGLVMDQIRRVAPRDTTILLGGETGTGKTRLARLVHDQSGRRSSPFLVVNCGALSTSLIESEMFGHVRGAFTGADRDRVGKFQEVGRGTLLLDEIDSLAPALQAKLLRVVEDRVFEPVGSNRSLPLEARLVVASNRSLAQEVAAGRFRADLYYRLNVVSFELPPLRDRAGVIAELARALVVEFAAKAGRAAPGLDPEAIRLLRSHGWPGNLRELRNVVERAVVLCEGDRITPDDLPAPIRVAGPGPATGAEAPPRAVAAAPPDRPETGTLADSKERAEALRIIDALTKHRNNRLRAAAELGISRMTLYNKLRKYDIVFS